MDGPPPTRVYRLESGQLIGNRPAPKLLNKPSTTALCSVSLYLVWEGYNQVEALLRPIRVRLKLSTQRASGTIGRERKREKETFFLRQYDDEEYDWVFSPSLKSSFGRHLRLLL